MAYENGNQTQAPEQEEKQRPEDQRVPEQGLFGMPNSLVMAMPAPPPGTPNSVMREMLDEAEAESFSGRSVFDNMNTVRRHRSLSAGASLGNGGLLSGMNGSSPFFSGHELVHTIRHTAAPALVSRSAVFNTIQRAGDEEEEEEEAEHSIPDLPDDLEILVGNRLIRQSALTEEEIRSRSENRTVSTTVVVKRRPEDNLVIHDSRKHGLEYVIVGDGQYEVLKDGVWCRAAAAGTLQPPVSDPQSEETVPGSDASDSSGSSTGSSSNPPLSSGSSADENPGDDSLLAADADADREDVPEGSAPLPVPAVPTKSDINQAIDALCGRLDIEDRRLTWDMLSHKSALQRMLARQDDKLRQMTKSPDQLERMAVGQVRDGMYKLHKDLIKIKDNVAKAKKPTDDDLQQFMWEVQQKDRELQGLLDLKTRKLSELSGGPNGQKSKLEQELEAITNGVNKDTGQPDAGEGLPDPATVFDLNADGTPRSRSKLALLSKRPININGMVKYYRAWCKLNGRDLGEEGRANDPIEKGLKAAQAALAGGGGGGGGQPPAPAPAPAVVDGGGGQPPAAAPVVGQPPAPAPEVVDVGGGELPPVPVDVEEPPASLEGSDREDHQDDSTIPKPKDTAQREMENTVQREPGPNQGGGGQSERQRAFLASLERRPVRERRGSISSGQQNGGARADMGRPRRDSLPSHLASVPFAAPPARAAAPPPVAAPAPRPRSNYLAADDTLKQSQWHTANARLAQSIGGTINNWGAKFGTLMHNYNNNVTKKEKSDLKPWDKKKWDLTESHGNYRAYTDWVAPSINLGLGIYGMGTSGAGMIHGMNETARKAQNVKAGASHADWIQSGLDTIGSAGSFMSSAWSTWQSGAQLLSHWKWLNSFEKVGNYLNKSTFGHAKEAIPGLSIATGSISAATGTMEAIRGRMTRSELHDAEKEMKKAGREAPVDPNAPAPVPGVKTDQQKLKDIMTQGHQVAKFHMWSGGLKAAAGGLSAAGGIASLTGAAPVAAAFQGTAALVNIAKFAFDRAYTAHMRKTVVASELNIDWDQEMKDVMTMVHSYNSEYNMRDKYIREIILKAHGSGEAATRTAAYKQIKLKRANYLIDMAENPGTYQQTAKLVIKAMGVYLPDGQTKYPSGARELLAEKLG